MRIAFITPTTGYVPTSWAMHMFQIISSTQDEKFFIVPKHYCIDSARNQGVLTALNQGADYIVFVDSDVIPHILINGNLIFDPNVINHMISYRYPIISGVYITTKGHPAVYRYTGDEVKPYEPVELKDLLGKITYADAVGCGIVCIDRRVFEVLMDKGYFPWFEYRTKYEREETIKLWELSEDIDFFDKCRRCGFRVMVYGNVFGVHIHKFRILPDGYEVDKP